jgi:hypothetical protein
MGQPNPSLERGDFVGIGPEAIGIDINAQEPLLSLLERSGELLSLKPDELNIVCLNVTECFDCLDHERVSWVLLAWWCRLALGAAEVSCGGESWGREMGEPRGGAGATVPRCSHVAMRHLV